MQCFAIGQPSKNVLNRRQVGVKLREDVGRSLTTGLQSTSPRRMAASAWASRATASRCTR